MIKKEWLLLAGTVVMTLGLALGVIRVVAPQLLGGPVPVDRQVVQLAKEVPPFFDVVLNPADLTSERSLVNDPYVGHRRAVMVPENTEFNAPFDLLGFRNRSVPVVADVVTVGDSQTVGTGAPLDQNWPQQMERLLAGKNASVYNMSVGGWGAVQYLYMFEKAAMFRPRVVVVAFYTGNDPIDSAHMAYNFEPWASLRAPERPESAPVEWPPKDEDVWAVRFDDGVTTGFTAKTRLSSNDRSYPGTVDAYRIMGDVAERIDGRAKALGVAPVFIIIPTKELVFAPRVRAANLAAPEDYLKLVTDETRNIQELAARLEALPNSRYLDVVGPMQSAAMAPWPLYPEGNDGHPVAAGYRVIAQAVSLAVAPLLPRPLQDGVVIWDDPEQPGSGKVYLVRDGGARRFVGMDVFRGNGWAWEPERIRAVSQRDLAGLRNLGVIDRVNPAAFGPRP